VRLAADGAPVGLNVYPSKGGSCKVVFDNAETPAADEIAALLGARRRTKEGGLQAVRSRP
jgi:hypothetical protein